MEASSSYSFAPKSQASKAYTLSSLRFGREERSQSAYRTRTSLSKYWRRITPNRLEERSREQTFAFEFQNTEEHREGHLNICMLKINLKI
jgi:hypothetical protein